MKAFKYPKLNPIFLLIGMLLSALTAHAAPPVINSPSTASAVLGEPFVYTITTVDDDGMTYSHSPSELPKGLTRAGAVLSGVPEEVGEFTITFIASNADGDSAEHELLLSIVPPVPVINSELSATGRVGQPFSYNITASNAPTSYTTIGLPAGLSLDSSSGIISGTPTKTVSADVLLIASNAAGQSDSVVLNLIILPALSAPSSPSVSITSPSAGLTLEGNVAQFTVQAKVTPVPGEEIDTVFVRWTNPPAPLSEIITNEMSLVATDPATGEMTFSADVPVGYNANDREIGGGSIDIEVIAYQTNSESEVDAGSDTVSFTIKPLLEFLFPDDAFAMDSIEIGDVFASARVNTNDFVSVSARIAGPSIVDIVTDNDDSDNDNGVFNFLATKRIDYPGLYDIRITAEDGAGNLTILERQILISDSLAEPVANLTSPTPGFTNEVFSAATFNFNQTVSNPVTVEGVGVVGYEVTYALSLINGGQGYYPRNAEDVALLATDATTVTLAIPGITISNGRVTEMPDEFTIFYLDDGVSLPDPRWNTSGSAVLDDLNDPGRNAWVSIAGQFFKANAELDSYKLFVNGEDVTPGSGNLDPTSGVLDVPVLFYPGTGRGSPPPGDYIVYAQVTDQQGEVGTSEPLTFSILPYEPLELTMYREGAGDIEQGQSVTYYVEVSPFDAVETVEFFDSESGESVGFASSTTIDGKDLFRYTQDFFDQGEFGLYAQVTAFNGQTALSEPVRVRVTPMNDLSVAITSPSADTAVFKGQSVSFTADASSTPGVVSVAWVVNNELIETDTEEPYEFTRLFDTVGSYRVLARATDNFGNILDSEPVTITVSVSDITVSITSPIGAQELVQGESLTFTAAASATIGVERVEWTVDGTIVETDTVAPYALTHEFSTVGSSSVLARAFDTLGNSSSSGSLTVQVEAPNPLLRDEDFVADIYQRLIGRAPTTDERSSALAQLNGTTASRAAFLADLLNSDSLESATIASLIFRTMTGEWPDSSEIAECLDVLTNGGTGALDANTLTYYLVPEYESRFAVLNTESGFVRQLFKNKHGVDPTAQSYVRLYNSAVGVSEILLSNGVSIPYYAGDTISFATQFALDNDSSGYQGVDGFPLSSLHFYSMPNNPANDSLLAVLISALLGVEPRQSEIDALKSMSLVEAVSFVLTDSRYYSGFPTSTAAGYVALRMAELGVFDASLNGDSDDADGDGITNIEEILLNTDPSDVNDLPVSSGSTTIDGTDFVLEFVRLKLSETPSGVGVVVECSDLSTNWNLVPDLESKLSLAADQSGIDSDYERVEFRVDMTVIPCNFFRLSVQ